MGGCPGGLVESGAETRLKAYLMASVVARTRGGRTARMPQGMCAAQVAVFGIRAGTYLPPGNSERGDRLWLTGEDQAHSDSMGLAYGTIPISPTPAGTLTPASSSSNRRFVPTDPGPGATPMGMNFRASPGATGDGERGAGSGEIRKHARHPERSNAGIWPGPTAPTAIRHCKSRSRTWVTTGTHRPCEISTRIGRAPTPRRIRLRISPMTRTPKG